MGGTEFSCTEGSPDQVLADAAPKVGLGGAAAAGADDSHRLPTVGEEDDFESTMQLPAANSAGVGNLDPPAGQPEAQDCEEYNETFESTGQAGALSGALVGVGGDDQKECVEPTMQNQGQPGSPTGGESCDEFETSFEAMSPKSAAATNEFDKSHDFEKSNDFEKSFEFEN